MINFAQPIMILFGDPIPEDMKHTRLTESDEDV